MSEIITGTTPTEEPVSGQAPAADSSPVFLPKDYLAQGYYGVTDSGAKFLRRQFVGEYAEIMANLLAFMELSDFNGLVREMRRGKKKELPYEARMTIASEVLIRAMVLAHQKKAPALLFTFVKDNLDHITCDDDWFAFLRHLEAIAAYMAVQKGGEA